MRACRCPVRKGTELSVTWDIRQFSWHLNFRNFGADGLCRQGFFSISGLWSFDFFFVIVFNRRAHDFSLWWIDPWVFVFFWFSGVISRYLVFGFLVFSRFRLLRMRASRFLVQESTELSVTGDIRQFSWHWNFRSSGPDGLCGQSFFPYLVFGFLSFSLWLFLIGAPCDFSHGEIFWWIDPWVFVFFFVRGLFAMSGVWSFGFQSIQILTYACVSISGPKKRGFQRVGCGGGNVAFFADKFIFGHRSLYLWSLFFVSGVWISVYFVVIVLSTPYVFCFRIGKFCDESTLGFLFFFLCSGSFRDIRCLDIGLTASQEQRAVQSIGGLSIS